MTSPLPRCLHSPLIQHTWILTIQKTQFKTNCQFNKSYIDTPNEFQNSEPTLQTPFQHILTQTPEGNSSAPTSYKDAIPIFSPIMSDQPNSTSPVTEELEYEFHNFTTLQQQLQNNKTLTFHNLASSVSSSIFSNPTITVD